MITQAHGPLAVFMAVMREAYGFRRKSAVLTVRKIMQLTGITKRQNVHRAIKQAESMGLIVVIKTDDKSRCNYLIVKDYSKWNRVIKSDDVIKTDDKRNQERLHRVIKTDDSLYVKETLKKPLKKTEPKPDPDFDKFWDAYPKKEGKKPAAKAWAKTNGNRPPIDQILAHIEKRKSIWSEYKFIPHPTTFINQERWNDDLTAAVQKPVYKRPRN